MPAWILKPFAELTPAELYAALQLRNEVFVVEQNCVFQDADNKDPQCWHLMGFEGAILGAYTRLVPPGLIYEQASIGRVVTNPVVRRSGLGRQLMNESIRRCTELFGPGPIKIGAQQYLEQFYRSFGFETAGDPYLEDGIPHLYMIKPGVLR